MRADWNDGKLRPRRPRKRDSIPAWAGNLTFLQRALKGSGSQPAVCLIVTEMYSAWVKRKGFETDH